MTGTQTRRPTAAVPAVVKKLCALVAQLEQTFAGRSFTLDGHLVGSIGEVLAAEQYDLKLLPMNEKKHDARSNDGRLVQIKTTQGMSVGLYSKPDFLLVLTLSDAGTITEVYNGPGSLAWSAAGKMQKNGQRSIGVAKLRALNMNVPPKERIPLVRPTLNRRD